MNPLKRMPFWWWLLICLAAVLFVGAVIDNLRNCGRVTYCGHLNPK